jgi:transcription elongation factor S-II
MPPKSKYPIVILEASGDVKDEVLQVAKDVTIDSLKSFFKKKAVVETIGTYPYKTSTLFLFGVLNGKEGEENKHQLPPPHDSIQVYSDIVILASSDANSFKTPVAFKQSDYETFYSKQFGGYASDEDELEEEQVEEGKEFAQDEEEGEVEVEAEVEEEGEEEEEGEVEAEAEVEVEGEAEVETIKPKAKRKKAAAKPVVLNMVGPANAYANKPTLSEEQQLQEEIVPIELVDNVRKQIFRVIEKTFTSKLTHEQICTLEMCIYNGAIHESKQRNLIRSWTYPLFVHVYKMRARKILSNFNETSYVGNTELFTLFKEGTIDFKGLSAMNTYELFPSRWRDQFEKQQIREKKQLEGNRNMATDHFLCGRCHKRECTYYEMQTRSADEPMTIFITCLNCGKHWRQ